jgi:hypothetical protein
VDGSWDEYFAKRKWRIASEETGEVTDGPATVRFLQGAFTIEGGKFHSPLSSARGSKGVLLQEVGPRGADVDGSQIAVGVVTLRQARKRGAVRK